MRSWRGAAGRMLWGGGLAAGVLAGSVLVGAAPASAHVTVDSDEAVAGDMARVVFRMPNESPSDPSTRLEIHLLPEGAPPIASVLTTPVPGWSVEVERESLAEPIIGAHGEQITEAVSVIAWTADDEAAAIQPGQFGEFPVEIGPLPEATELYFPALQSYAGADEPVRWIGRPDPDGAEPPDPAPVLQIAVPGSDGAGEASSGDVDDAAVEDANGGDSGGAGTWFGLAGLVAGLAGLALGGAAFARTRRNTTG